MYFPKLAVKAHYWIPETIQIILENTSRNKDGVTKTQLMYRASLSYIQLVEYLTLLRKSNLIEYRPSTATYRTAERGFRFLQVTKEMNQLVMARRA
jgi:predicted transcriptional regulator